MGSATSPTNPAVHTHWSLSSPAWPSWSHTSQIRRIRSHYPSYNQFPRRLPPLHPCGKPPSRALSVNRWSSASISSRVGCTPSSATAGGHLLAGSRRAGLSPRPLRSLQRLLTPSPNWKGRPAPQASTASQRSCSRSSVTACGLRWLGQVRSRSNSRQQGSATWLSCPVQPSSCSWIPSLWPSVTRG